MFFKTVETLYKVVGESSIWFHGRTSDSTEFKEEFTGKGHDAEGPGFYFTSSEDDAYKYASPSGIIIQAEVAIRKLTPKKAKKSDITTLIKNAPDLEDTLTNWDENPVKAMQLAIGLALKDDTPYLQVWIDFYRNEPAEYLKQMVKLGYDGHEVEKSNGVKHLVVYNPKTIKIVKTTPFKSQT